MKKLLTLLLASSAIAATAQTSFTDGPLTFTVTSDTDVSLTGVASKDASGAKYDSYTVPAKVTNDGVEYTVTTIGEQAFKWNHASSITLPSTIKTLENSAFDGTDHLTSITLPDGLETIGEYCFSSSALTTIDIPASVTTIGGSAFFTCKSMTSITLHEGLKEIGNAAFYKVPLTSVTLPASLRKLGDKAFLLCPDLASVTLVDGLTELGAGTFNGCTALPSISIPASVKKIGDECFLECSSLTSVDLPAGLEELGTSVFAKTKIKTLTLPASNKAFTLDNGILYSANKNLLYFVPMTGVSQVTVASKCIGINGGAFWGSEVSKVTVPDGMLAIDDYAFCQSALAEINFPATITYIGEQAFAATQLTSVVLPANMPYILDGAFAGCEKLTTVTIPSGVKLIYNHAFHNDKAITSFTCLGSRAPEIDDVYESYDDPFFGIPANTPLYVPAGAEASYKAAGWNNSFKIIETEASVLSYESATPADGTVLGKYADMKVELTFSSDVTIVKAQPEVFLRKGSEISGAIIEPEDCWKATQSGAKNTVNIWASDYDGFTQYFTTENDQDYYLIIPAGVVKDSDGNMNERIVITWHGPVTPAPLEVVSTDPADGSAFTSTYADMAIDVTFAKDVTTVTTAPDCKLYADEIGGATVDPDMGWITSKQSDGKTIRFWGSDYDGFLQTFNVTADKYIFVIPAGVVKDADGSLNAEIVVTVYNKEYAGAIDIEATGAEVREVYDLQGRRLDAPRKGVNIVRLSDGTTLKIVVR